MIFCVVSARIKFIVSLFFFLRFAGIGDEKALAFGHLGIDVCVSGCRPSFAH